MDTTSLPINYANNQTKPDETSLLDIILWSQIGGGGVKLSEKLPKTWKNSKRNYCVYFTPPPEF